MKNKQIIGLVVAGAVFIVTGVTSVLTNTLSANTMAEDVTTMLAGELAVSYTHLDVYKRQDKALSWCTG